MPTNARRLYLHITQLFVGATLTVILRIPITESVVLSACVAVFYTLIGGLYAVAYTDVIQLCSIMAGLVTANAANQSSYSTSILCPSIIFFDTLEIELKYLYFVLAK